MDEAAFLRAIAAEPDDDAPRLVFADWLDEHGQPERAEFIRVECESARTDRHAPTYPSLLRRSDQLLTDWAPRWFGPLVNRAVSDHIVTSRGFVDTFVLSPDKFTAHAELIRASAPVLRGLHVTDGGDWRAFFATPALATIRDLSFEDGVFTADAAAELAASKYTAQLTELEVARQPLGPDGMMALAAAPLWRLERLIADESGIGDSGASGLFACEAFRNLRELDLSENGLSNTACIALATASEFDRLESLTLCNNRITAAGVSALAAAPHLGRLQSLNLYQNPIGPAGGRAILASRHWGRLTHLGLVGCGVGVEVAGDLRWVYGDQAIQV